MTDKPVTWKPMPSTPSPDELSYAIESIGSIPARPGGETSGMVYDASPVLVTEKEPGIVPAAGVGGATERGGDGLCAASYAGQVTRAGLDPDGGLG